MRSSALARVTTVLVALCLPIAVVAAFVKDDDADSPAAHEVDADGGGSATPGGGGSLGDAADRTAATDHLRYESTITIEGGPFDVEPIVLGAGEQAGASTHARLDPGALAGALGAGADDLGDQTLDMYSDGTHSYVHAPGYAAMADAGVPLPPILQPLVDLGDRWGVIDLSQASMLGVADQFGGSSLNVASGLELVRQLVDDIEPAGKDDVHDEPVDVYEGTIAFGQMVEVSGLDADQFEAILGGALGPGGPNIEDLVDAMNEARVTVQVGVDHDGLVRRIAYVLGDDYFGAVADGLGLDVDGDELGFEMTSTIELFDVGDQSITVEIPPIEDPVDLTQWALEMSGAQTD